MYHVRFKTFHVHSLMRKENGGNILCKKNILYVTNPRSVSYVYKEHIFMKHFTKITVRGTFVAGVRIPYCIVMIYMSEQCRKWTKHCLALLFINQIRHKQTAVSFVHIQSLAIIYNVPKPRVFHPKPSLIKY